MTKSKHTKKALFGSVIALILCCSMLVGTTFAWFTDAAKTGLNMIQSGTLDIALLNADGTENIEGKSLSFQNVDGSKDILWEPGVTFVTDGFQVANLGNLWLKYKVEINGITTGSAKLLEAIDFWFATDVSTTAQAAATKVEYPMDAVLAPKGEADDNSGTYYLVGHMKEEAGNEYQNLTLEGCGITVYATQKDAEFDSFNNTYDKDAEYVDADQWDGTTVTTPALLDGVYQINSASDLAGFHEVLKAAYVGNPEPYVKAVLNTSIDLDGHAWTPIGAEFSNAFAGVFDGQGYTVYGLNVETTGAAGLFGNSRGTIQNLTVSGASVTGGEWVGGVVGYSYGDVTSCQVLNSVITGTEKVGGIVGDLISADVTSSVVRNSYISGDETVGGVAGRIRADGAAPSVTGNTVDTVTVISKDAQAGAVVAAVVAGTVERNTETNVTVTGNASSTVETVGTAGDLTALGNVSEEGVLVLTSDIDMKGASLAAIGAAYGKSLIIDGNGHTISNVTLEAGTHNGMQNYGLFYAYTNTTLTIKNLTVENVTVDTTNDTDRNYGAAVILGYVDGGSSVVLENVDVKNSSVKNTHDEAAVYVGYATGTITMIDCDSTGCSVEGETAEKTGAFIGHLNGTATLRNCTTDLTIGTCNRVTGTLTEE